ncbi:MAG: hypothetical protein RBS80_17365 [Thermoguttaceae bacterium]|jgi:hypothetical protein|nr:hypothetical protein [Thermoguttaceae bacterium]
MHSLSPLPIRPHCAFAAHGLVLAVAAMTAGCGQNAGERRYDLSGRVTYRGQPVPGGRILFSPDASQGADGPATVADIAGGRYQTRPGRGAVAGPYIVTIHGTDETMATETHDNTLFPPYETRVDVDSAHTTHDFEVPSAVP